MTTAVKSVIQTLRRYIKAPWSYTGPQSGPEYLSAVPKATDYRVFCPATSPAQAIVPASEPDTVFDIKYFPRDQRRNRPPVRRTVLRKTDVEKLMRESRYFDDAENFPKPYLTAIVEEDMNAIGGGYQK